MEAARKKQHARKARVLQALHWAERKRLVRIALRRRSDRIESNQEFYIDAGYCLDRP